MVIAKTVDGEIGIMPQHAPVLGVLVEGGVLRVKPARARATSSPRCTAVSSPWPTNEVSVLAEVAELGSEVDVAAARDALERAQASIEANQEDADARHRGQAGEGPAACGGRRGLIIARSRGRHGGDGM